MSDSALAGGTAAGTGSEAWVEGAARVAGPAGAGAGAGAWAGAGAGAGFVSVDSVTAVLVGTVAALALSVVFPISTSPGVC